MHGLKQISGERLWMELRKILSGNFAADLTLRMISLGIGPYVGLPEQIDTEGIKIVYERLQGLEFNSITPLSATLKTEEDVSFPIKVLSITIISTLLGSCFKQKTKTECF
jgi:tRNA nucleotidyltransferase (CCA-adding enzyme)